MIWSPNQSNVLQISEMSPRNHYMKMKNGFTTSNWSAALVSTFNHKLLTATGVATAGSASGEEMR